MVSATECEGVLCFLWSSYCNQIYFTYPKILHLLLRSRKHQFDAVQLVYFACSRIIIDCNDVGFRMTAAQFFNNTFSDYVVWQTGERLCADNVWCTAVDQLQHFSGKDHPSPVWFPRETISFAIEARCSICDGGSKRLLAFSASTAGLRNHSRALIPRLPMRRLISSCRDVLL